MSKTKIGVIGAGKMGGVLTRVILDKNLVSPENLLVCEKVEEKLHPFLQRGVRVCSIEKLSEQADVIIIAVKPQDVKVVLESLKGRLNPSQMVVSIVAGVTISSISRIIGESVPVLRIMPNSAILVGEGICAFSRGPGIDEKRLTSLLRIFQAVGDVVEISEEKMDAVTGLSGSGPAYVYTTIEGLIKGGEKMGLPRDISRKLATQTVLGAAKLVKESNKNLKELISSVATPGGTTVEGLKVLEKGDFVDTLARAVVKSAQRARQISLEIDSEL